MTTPSSLEREHEHAEIRSVVDAFLGQAYDDLDESERDGDFWCGYRDGVCDFAFSEWNRQNRRSYPPSDEPSRHNHEQRVAQLLKAAKDVLAVNPRSDREDRALARVLEAREAFAALVAFTSLTTEAKEPSPTTTKSTNTPTVNVHTVSSICVFCGAIAPTAEPPGWARWSRDRSDDFPLPYFFSTCPEHSTHEGLWADAPRSRPTTTEPPPTTCGYDAIPGASSARAHEIFRRHGWHFCPECAAPVHTPETPPATKCGYDAIPGASSARVHELLRLFGRRFCPECATPLRTTAPASPSNQPESNDTRNTPTPTVRQASDASGTLTTPVLINHKLTWERDGDRWYGRTPSPADEYDRWTISHFYDTYDLCYAAGRIQAKCATLKEAIAKAAALQEVLDRPHTLPDTPPDLSDLQRDVREWHAREFDPLAPPNPMANGLMLCEEAGEVARCLVKRHQHVRGDQPHWDAELRKEIGDVVITALNLASDEGFDLAEVVRARWADVRQRRFATASPNQPDASSSTPEDTSAASRSSQVSQ